MDGVSEVELQSLAKALQSMTAEEAMENLGIEELRAAAQLFLKSYRTLERVFSLQQLSMLKSMISNQNDESGNTTIGILLKTRNAKTVYTRSKYLLAFNFDEVLSKFREQVPRYAAYVYVGPDGVPQTFKMPLKEMIVLLNKQGRIGNPTDIFFLKNEYGTLEQEQMKEMGGQQDHIKIAQAAYQGTVNRLNRYYDVFGLSGSFRQGGRLLWLEGPGKWAIAKVNNGGDLKEAYVAALMARHKEDKDPLCYDDIGIAPYFNHMLIKDFFNNYIFGVTNMAAIREEDVVADSGQYAVKGARASAPSFQQYVTVAEAILTQNITSKEELEDYIAQVWNQDTHRNTVEKIIETTTDKTIVEIAKMLNAKVND